EVGGVGTVHRERQDSAQGIGAQILGDDAEELLLGSIGGLDVARNAGRNFDALHQGIERGRRERYLHARPRARRCFQLAAIGTGIAVLHVARDVLKRERLVIVVVVVKQRAIESAGTAGEGLLEAALVRQQRFGLVGDLRRR